MTLLEVSAAQIAKKAQPGQFIILRIDEEGSGSLTIADFDREKGTITIIFQKVGLTTLLLGDLNWGTRSRTSWVLWVSPTHVDESVKRVCVVGGGVGCAIAYPQAKYLHKAGITVDVIAGFRSKDIVILEEEFKAACTNFYLTTDDGTYGGEGLRYRQAQESLIDGGNQYDLVIAIGPIPMMKFVSKTTEPYGIKTLVSLNPIMVDGTGMCGAHRVTVGNQVKFACVDGPDFDGHQVDYDELMNRNSVYRDQEAAARRSHACRMETLGKELIK